MVVVVTGGAGYIGTHVIDQLIKSGFTPVVIDNLSAGKKENFKKLKNLDYSKFILENFFEADFSDLLVWKKIFERFEVFAVVHLAAKIDATESLTQVESYLENNFYKTQQLLKILIDCNIKNLIFASTAAVYGRSKLYPIPESSELSPLNPYGESKMRAEQAIESACKEFNNNQLTNQSTKQSFLRAVCLRFFNVAGTDPSINILPSNSSGLIAQLASSIQNNKTFYIYSDDYDTFDGSCIRDFVSPVDIGRAIISTLKDFNNDSSNLSSFSIFNIGNGKGYSIKEIIKEAEKIIGKSISVRITDRRADEIPISVADNSLIKKQLNFNLKHSDLQTLLKTSLLSTLD